jgi:hypothetical protein
MALTNAQRQARYRERHIKNRRDAQRVANLLMLKQMTDEHVKAVAVLLTNFFNRAGIRTLRRELQRIADPGQKDKKEMLARQWEEEKAVRAAWKREHPGRTFAEYDRLVRDGDSEVWQWRRAKGHAINEAERLAYERDHPGEEWPEHLCGLSDREYTDYLRWLRQRERKNKRDGPSPSASVN